MSPIEVLVAYGAHAIVECTRRDDTRLVIERVEQQLKHEGQHDTARQSPIVSPSRGSRQRAAGDMACVECHACEVTYLDVEVVTVKQERSHDVVVQPLVVQQ